jgi:hypothetical protein
MIYKIDKNLYPIDFISQNYEKLKDKTIRVDAEILHELIRNCKNEKGEVEEKEIQGEVLYTLTFPKIDDMSSPTIISLYKSGSKIIVTNLYASDIQWQFPRCNSESVLLTKNDKLTDLSEEL